MPKIREWTDLDKLFVGKPLHTSGGVHHSATKAQRRKGTEAEAKGKVRLRRLW